MNEKASYRNAADHSGGDGRPLNHSDLYYTYYTNTDSVLTFSVSLLLSCICRINVPLFMMITGALLIPKPRAGV